MCGIAGIVAPQGSVADRTARVAVMTAALDHRGPDAAGWIASRDGAAVLGHARLSVIDLSDAGRQPMTSHCGRYVMTFNGEIYNFEDLRAQLASPGLAFRGHSDTEVLLEAISAWGLERALRAVDGMFALAVWDQRERVLLLARDRIGEKPLYYGWYGGEFLFASELKAFTAAGNFRPDIDRDALGQYARFNYIPDPHCVFEGFRKLVPGTWCAVSPDAGPRLPQLREYWSLRAVAERGLGASADLDEREAVDQLDELLQTAVRRRAVADVPLGAFLSGGIDSSTIVALMQAQNANRVKTFSVGFDIPGYDEAPHARAVATHLDTDHTELYVDAAQAQAVIPTLPHLYDEPFADSSQIPTCLVSRLARRHVTVAMSGDAGDELFAGYLRYAMMQDIWRWTSRFPVSMRRLAMRALQAPPPRAWDGAFSLARGVLPRRLRYSTPGDKIHKFAGLLDAATPMELYSRLISLWRDPSRLVLGIDRPVPDLRFPEGGDEAFDDMSRMMYLDTTHYLPGDILVKVDRAAMACSLETRIPFLDPDVIEFAWRLPPRLRIRNGKGKWLVRQVLGRYVPSALFDRPKQGFGVPIDSWLRGPLRSWAEELLAERRLREAGYFDADLVRSAWQAHLSGSRNLQYALWGVLSFEAWRDAWKY